MCFYIRTQVLQTWREHWDIYINRRIKFPVVLLASFLFSNFFPLSSTSNHNYVRTALILCQWKSVNNKNKEEFYLSQTENYIAWQSTSQVTLRNCSQEAWFSAQFSVLSEQSLNKSGIHIFKISKKEKKTQHVHSGSVWPWCLEGKDLKHWCPGKGNI